LAPLTSNAEKAAHVRTRGHVLEMEEILDPEPIQAAADALVIIDGLFLRREELCHYWDFSMFLDVPFAVTAERMAVRDGTPADDAHNARYVGGQRLYFATADPALKASLVLENGRLHWLRVLLRRKSATT
jgi:uridine kinase